MQGFHAAVNFVRSGVSFGTFGLRLDLGRSLLGRERREVRLRSLEMCPDERIPWRQLLAFAERIIERSVSRYRLWK
jgi:hypothetical protein